MRDVRRLDGLRGSIDGVGFEWEVLLAETITLRTHARILLYNGMPPTRFFLASSVDVGHGGPLVYLSGKMQQPWEPFGFIDCFFGRVLHVDQGESLVRLDQQKLFEQMVAGLPAVVDRLRTHL